jgi:ribose transport system ATP-binding protein
LSAPERAEVAIARALRDHAVGTGLIILDESTRALSGDDLARVHGMLRRITAEGSAAIMISHNLTELMSVTDRMTILRDGHLAGAGLPTHDLSEADIARRILGGQLQETLARPTANGPPRTPTIFVSGLTGRTCHGVDFTVARGEILGVTGLPGNGYEEIPYLLTGAQKAASGSIRTGTHTVDLARGGVAACLRAGVVLVPERRERDGLAFDLSMRDNISLPALRRRGQPWFVSRAWQISETESAIDTLDIKPRSPLTLIKELSGGNQQKVLLAKWLTMGPQVLVLHEPTQAVDVGARRDILEALRRAAGSQVAVILVSSEPEDLAVACDRVLVYSPAAGLTEATATTPDALISQIYATDQTESAGSPS